MFKTQLTKYVVTCVLCLWIFTGCTTDNSPSTVHQGPSAALIITSDYQTGSYATVDMNSKIVHKDIDLIHQDAVCRIDPLTQIPYVVARLGADAIDVVDPHGGWKIIREFSVGPGTNPQDIAVVSEHKAFVTKYAETEILVVDPSNGNRIGVIDLSEYADEDGIPEISWTYLFDDKLYVLIQRLDRFSGFTPTDYSQLLVIDINTHHVVSALTLAQTNPSVKLRYNPHIGMLVIGETGSYSTSENTLPDGAIEYLDPTSDQLSGPVITGEILGGDIIDVAIRSQTKGYAIIAVVNPNGIGTHLVSFNPLDGEKRETIASSESWIYNTIELNPTGTELWLADQSQTAAGIRIFDTITDEEITDVPINVGLPPFMICFVNNN